MMCHRRIPGTILCACVAAVLAASLCHAQEPVLRIALVLDGSSEDSAELLNTFKTEITELLGSSFDVRFPESMVHTGDWRPEGVRQAVDAALADPDADIVLTLGAISSFDVCRRTELPRPVIAPFVLSQRLAGAPMKDGASGVKNLSYLCPLEATTKDLSAFKEVTPFDRVAVLYKSEFRDWVPDLQENADDLGKRAGVTVLLVPVGDSADETLAAIPKDAQAVYITPLLGLEPAEFAKLVRGVNGKNLPSFSMTGREEVEQGVLASAGLPKDRARLARRTAIHVQRIVHGEEPGELSVAVSQARRLTLNMATARAIGFSPTWDVLTEADLLHEEPVEGARKVTLLSAVQEAVKASLDLAAQGKSVSAGQTHVDEAWSNVKPHVEASTLGLVIDEDRAGASMGMQPERTWTGTLSATQVVFSEPALANIRIQQYLQRGRELDLNRAELDVSLEAAITYLNVLRVKTYERIQKNNLRLTRSHLDVARIRREAGKGSPAEVYRWESEIANSRKALIDVGAKRSQAEIALNRLLHRPLEEPFATADDGLEDLERVTCNERFRTILVNPATFKAFREFAVAEGLAAAPELQQVDKGIAAQERLVQSTRRAYFAPTVALKGEVTRKLWDDGAGTEGGLPIKPRAAELLPMGDRLVGVASSLLIDMPSADDTDWNIGLHASLPLYTGGARKAERIRAMEELESLVLKRESAAQRIEQFIRSALLAAQASYANIEQSRLAAEAARKNLDLVTDAYAEGVVSIIDLLDAQTASTVAEQLAASSVFDFLADLMEVHRAVGRFDLLESGEMQNAWFDRFGNASDAK